MTDRTRFGIAQRLVALVTIVLAAGLITAGATTFLIQRGQIETRTDAELLQEIEELRTRSSQANSDGQPYRRVDVLLEDFLRFNVPGSDEAMAAFVGGSRTPAFVSGGEREVDLQDPAVLDEIASARTTGRTVLRSVDTGDQNLRIAVSSVQGDGGEGILVVGINQGSRMSQLYSLMRVYAIAATLTLLVAAVGLHLAVRRLLSPLGELLAATEAVDDRDLSRRVEVPGPETEVSALARTFNRMLDRLEHSFRGQRRFLDDTAHELRTPLTIMRGNLEVLDVADVEDVETTVQIELGEIDRMRRIVDELLLLARLERPDFVRPEPTDVAKMHADLVSLVPGLGDREWVDEGGVEGTVELDRDRIVQAVQQLCANAVKFGKPADRIGVRTQWLGDGDARQLVISVSDEGPGISTSEHGRIFDRFHRAGDRRASEGSGLGLAIVKAVAQAHDGTAEVESVPGEGSTFRLILPAPTGNLRSTGTASRRSRS